MVNVQAKMLKGIAPAAIELEHLNENQQIALVGDVILVTRVKL